VNTPDILMVSMCGANIDVSGFFGHVNAAEQKAALL